MKVRAAERAAATATAAAAIRGGRAAAYFVAILEDGTGRLTAWDGGRWTQNAGRAAEFGTMGEAWRAAVRNQPTVGQTVTTARAGTFVKEI